MELMDISGRSARMSDVAKLAGVARVTVSRVLNNAGEVSEERKTAVLAAAKSLHYQRNFNASALAGGRAFVVGALVSDLNDSTVAETLGILSDALTRAGFHLFVAQSHGATILEDRLLIGFGGRRVSAIVLLGVSRHAHALLRARHLNLPIAEFWDIFEESAETNVSKLVQRLGV